MAVKVAANAMGASTIHKNDKALTPANVPTGFNIRG
jgi:hypothetical protein